MMKNKKKGYIIERKIKLLFEKHGWKVVRAGGSIGEADLVCVKNGKCIFIQIKSSKKQALYYYGYKKDFLEGFPFYLLVDFGYGKIRILKPADKVTIDGGESIEKFIKKFK